MRQQVAAGIAVSRYNAAMPRLIETLRGALTLALIVLNIVFWFVPIFVMALVKLAVPVAAFRRWLSRLLIACAENWISGNKWILDLLTPTRWRIRDVPGLNRNDWYLVVSNHQTWVDVLALQYVFNRRVPFFKFFIKQQLVWVPFLGIAWWALDMPFMRRYSKTFLKRHPEKRGSDLATTRRACERFRTIPTSVFNFIEGTRSTPEKIRQRESPYRFLLRPRSGGIAFALGAMGEQFRQMIDVTLYYPGDALRFWDLCCGRIGEIVVDIKVRELPDWLRQGDYATDLDYRQRFHAWIARIWGEKDALLADLHAAPARRPEAG
ncbi:MAG: acyltransferase [Pseudomonadota bacterium]